MTRTGHAAGKTPSTSAISTIAKGKQRQAPSATVVARSKSAAAVAQNAASAQKKAVPKKNGKKRSGIFSLSPLKAFLHERADHIYQSGLFADQLSDNALGKRWLQGKALDKKRAKGSVRNILFAGDVPDLMRNIIERTLLARMMGANRVALGRRRRLDGTINNRKVQVTGADLRLAKDLKTTMFIV